MTSATADSAATAAAERSRVDRLLAAAPLVGVYLLLVTLYMAESVRHATPTIFTDELKWGLISRSIAEHGRPEMRGAGTSLGSLYALVIAPAWKLGSTASAYDAIKYLNALLMAATIFPTWALARRFVSQPAALVVGALAISIPAMAYDQFLLPEVIAYPWAALCAWLCVEALARRTRGWIAAAVVVSLLAPLVRGQLVVVPVAFATAAAALWWAGPRGRAMRARWSRGDVVAAALLALGVFVVLNRWAFYGVGAWQLTSATKKGWIFDNGVWALGALAIGTGVLPLLGGLLSLVPRRGERLTRADRSLIAVTGAFVAWFLLYTAVKAAYLQIVFSTRVTERNLIYVAPLLFLGTAVVLERRRVRLVPLLVLTGAIAYLLVATPFNLDFSYFEALGFSILSLGNRNFYWTPATMQWVLLAILFVSAALFAARALVRRPLGIAGGAAAATIAVLVLGWNLTGQIQAAAGNNHAARQAFDNLPQPADWLDRATGGGTVTYLGQHLSGDATGLYLTEFWNRSLVDVWSTDGSAPGPGRTLTPNLARADGTLSNPPGTDYVLADNGVFPVGDPIATRGQLRLYPLDGPIRLTRSVSDISPDGWAVAPDGESPATAAINQFETADHRAGIAHVELSRATLCGHDTASPGRATVKVGRLVIGPDKQAALGKVWATRRVELPNCHVSTLDVPVAEPPWRVEVSIFPAFRPADYPGESETRWLGAQPSARYVER